MTPERTILLSAARNPQGAVTGYALDRSRPSHALVVVAWLDGDPVGAAVADLYCEELGGQAAAGACHGFAFSFPPARLDAAKRLEIRVANREEIPGVSVDLRPQAARKTRARGQVVWSGGLRFTGSVEAAEGDPPRISAYIDQNRVAEALADRWGYGDPPQSPPRRCFDLHLPARFADGTVCRVHLRTDDGRELSGSPVTFWAAPGGLEATLDTLGATPGQRLQAAQFDRLLPNALPFSAYKAQSEAFKPKVPAEAAVAKTWAVAIPAGRARAQSLETLEAQTLSDWTCLAFSESGDAFSFDPDELAAFLLNDGKAVDWFLFLLAGLRLDASALARFDAAAGTHPQASLIYGDREVETAEGGLWPLAWPAFDYELMLEQGYFAPLFAVPRAVVERAVAGRVDNVFRLANLAFDDARAERQALHLPGPLAREDADSLADAAEPLARAARDHLAARGLDAKVTASPANNLCRVRRQHAQRPSVSILIPTRDRDDLLRDCLQSILGAMETARTEILIVDNETSEPGALAYLSELERSGVTVLRAPGPFNFARLNNLAAARARGDYLCFLNNDVVALDRDWLAEMLSRHADPSVGVVGAKLLWRNGVVQHGGVTLGVNFSPLHAFRDRLDGDPGFAGRLLCAHETGAVTAACMTTPRALFLESGGFDELRFPVNFNDVDYCLRLAARGLRIVLTPHARLQHRESASRGREERPDSAPRFQRELRSLRNLWGEALIADPSYSPLLALSDPPYGALAWPPRALAPRFRRVAPAQPAPAGF